MPRPSSPVLNEDTPKFRIQPHDIDATRQFGNSRFANAEREAAARVVVSICQGHGGWKPFARREFDARCVPPFCFRSYLNNLVEAGDIVEGPDNRFCVTERFVEICYSVAPASSR